MERRVHDCAHHRRLGRRQERALAAMVHGARGRARREVHPLEPLLRARDAPLSGRGRRGRRAGAKARRRCISPGADPRAARRGPPRARVSGPQGGLRVRQRRQRRHRPPGPPGGAAPGLLRAPRFADRAHRDVPAHRARRRRSVDRSGERRAPLVSRRGRQRAADAPRLHRAAHVEGCARGSRRVGAHRDLGRASPARPGRESHARVGAPAPPGRGVGATRGHGRRDVGRPPSLHSRAHSPRRARRSGRHEPGDGPRGAHRAARSLLPAAARDRRARVVSAHARRRAGRLRPRPGGLPIGPLDLALGEPRHLPGPGAARRGAHVPRPDPGARRRDDGRHRPQGSAPAPRGLDRSAHARRARRPRVPLLRGRDPRQGRALRARRRRARAPEARLRARRPVLRAGAARRGRAGSARLARRAARAGALERGAGRRRGRSVPSRVAPGRRDGRQRAPAARR